MKTNNESAGLRFLYRTAPGRVVLKAASARCVSRLVGKYLDSPLSRGSIRGFVRRNGIRLADYETDRFRSFNECFSRKIRPELRPIDPEPDALISPCDGLLSAYRIDRDTVLPIKQSRYTIPALLGGDALAREFCDGICLVFRLCVNHYHRYCYPVSGEKTGNRFLPGKLHTVRPIALASVPVFCENCREYTVIDAGPFGKVAQIEVGAMLVGKIKNHSGAGTVLRGEEKGYFEYGGSTIVVLLQKDRIALPQSLFDATAAGTETPVRMGERIGILSDSHM